MPNRLDTRQLTLSLPFLSSVPIDVATIFSGFLILFYGILRPMTSERRCVDVLLTFWSRFNFHMTSFWLRVCRLDILLWIYVLQEQPPMPCLLSFGGFSNHILFQLPPLLLGNREYLLYLIQITKHFCETSFVRTCLELISNVIFINVALFMTPDIGMYK